MDAYRKLSSLEMQDVTKLALRLCLSGMCKEDEKLLTKLSSEVGEIENIELAILAVSDYILSRRVGKRTYSIAFEES